MLVSCHSPAKLDQAANQSIADSIEAVIADIFGAPSEATCDIHYDFKCHGVNLRIRTNPEVTFAYASNQPPGSDNGDGWTWVSSNPNPVSGTLSSQSSVARGLPMRWAASPRMTMRPLRRSAVARVSRPSRPPRSSSGAGPAAWPASACGVASDPAKPAFRPPSRRSSLMGLAWQP